jgi:hypothetical protein
VGEVLWTRARVLRIIWTVVSTPNIPAATPKPSLDNPGQVLVSEPFAWAHIGCPFYVSRAVWGDTCVTQIPNVSLTLDGEECVPSSWPKYSCVVQRVTPQWTRRKPLTPSTSNQCLLHIEYFFFEAFTIVLTSVENIFGGHADKNNCWRDGYRKGATWSCLFRDENRKLWRLSIVGYTRETCGDLYDKDNKVLEQFKPLVDKYELHCQEKLSDMCLSKLPQRLSLVNLPPVMVREWEDRVRGAFTSRWPCKLPVVCQSLGTIPPLPTEFYESMRDGQFSLFSFVNYCLLLPVPTGKAISVM